MQEKCKSLFENPAPKIDLVELCRELDSINALMIYCMYYTVEFTKKMMNCLQKLQNLFPTFSLERQICEFSIKPK